jgi:hypothetical protein
MAIKSAKNLDSKKEIIDLRGPKGNAFFLLGRAANLAKELGKDVDDIRTRMKAGDYEHLIKVFDDEFGDYIDLYR